MLHRRQSDGLKCSGCGDPPIRPAREIRDETYRGILDAAMGLCDRAVLVVPPGKTAECASRFDALRQFVTVEFKAGQWPGTISWADPTTVYWLGLSEGCAAALGDTVDGLYEWNANDGLPEDLSLLCRDGREFLVSVAHERGLDGLTDDERHMIEERLPALGLTLGG